MATDPVWVSYGSGQAPPPGSARPSQPGGLPVETYQQTGRVINLDSFMRKLTLETSEGSKLLVRAGPQVVNFDQIQAGERVTATVTEPMVVLMRKAKQLAPAGLATTVLLAPLGPKPRLVLADTVDKNAQILALDPPGRRVSLELPDGRRQSLAVSQGVDLTLYRPGETIIVRFTEPVAIAVERP